MTTKGQVERMLAIQAEWEAGMKADEVSGNQKARVKMTDRPIPMTDSRGRPILSECEPQPEPGSVVLVNGEYGTAWQRFYSDGLWHSVLHQRTRDWDELLRQRNLVLVYDAPARDERGDHGEQA